MANAESGTTGEPRDHLIRKGGYYYRPNCSGYTTEVVAAGRYTKAEAEREAQIEPWHMRAVPLSEFSAASPEALLYAAHLRDLGFTVTPPKDAPPCDEARRSGYSVPVVEFEKVEAPRYEQ